MREFYAGGGWAGCAYVNVAKLTLTVNVTNANGVLGAWTETVTVHTVQID